MGLLDEIRSSGGRIGQTCSVEKILADLDDSDAADLIEALEGDLPIKSIARALAARDHKVHDNSLRRHRAAECKCAERGVHSARLARSKGRARGAR